MSVISFENVTVSYEGRRVLSDVSFAIPQGAFVGLLGANGAGKTTLLKTILGIIKPTSGTISVFGRPPDRGDASIGYMPQARRAPAHLGISGLDFVLSSIGGHRWGWPAHSSADKDAAWAALEEVGATHLARRPLGELSGGERQRIFIAQSLIGSPKLLLLDEPLISLDTGHQRAIIELVHRIGERLGIAVIFCAHEINPLLPVVDCVLYLGNSSAAIGSVDDVINGPVLSKLYGTHISVVRLGGRIFVMADDIDMEGCAHVHDV